MVADAPIGKVFPTVITSVPYETAMCIVSLRERWALTEYEQKQNKHKQKVTSTTNQNRTHNQQKLEVLSRMIRSSRRRRDMREGDGGFGESGTNRMRARVMINNHATSPMPAATPARPKHTVNSEPASGGQLSRSGREGFPSGRRSSSFLLRGLGLLLLWLGGWGLDGLLRSRPRRELLFVWAEKRCFGSQGQQRLCCAPCVWDQGGLGHRSDPAWPHAAVMFLRCLPCSFRLHRILFTPTNTVRPLFAVAGSWTQGCRPCFRTCLSPNIQGKGNHVRTQVSTFEPPLENKSPSTNTDNNSFAPIRSSTSADHLQNTTLQTTCRYLISSFQTMWLCLEEHHKTEGIKGRVSLTMKAHVIL
ncbi:hypothetical protein KCU61_g144, partial [Aureobasidium melanogenum]